MDIGIPKEIKNEEHRVAMVPGGVADFTRRGHTVWVEQGAGSGSGFPDAAYAAAGAGILTDAAEIWQRAELILKVKEPLPSEFAHMRAGQLLFTYLHLAADEPLTRALLERGVSAIAYETVEDTDGRLPLLEPMSIVAGRMAAQVVSHYLERHRGGRGVLLGGVPGVAPGHVIILGAGTVGANAAKVALGMGARVSLLDIDLERLRTLEDQLGGRLTTLYSNPANIAACLRSADAVIGSVLIRGARAPMLIRRDMLPDMLERSVIVDVAVDQGGCVESTRVTTHSQPTFVLDGILHYGVANMPGAVPYTASLALANATLPYALRLADARLGALEADPGLRAGLNTIAGHCVYRAVAEAFALPFTEPQQALHSASAPCYTAPLSRSNSGVLACDGKH